MNNNHSFDKKLACIIGIEKSLLLGRIYLFVEYNQKNQKNFREGKFWMYDSSSALNEVYPYMNDSSIRRWLRELEKDGWIQSGNFNKRNNDLTKWYTIGINFIEWLKDEGDDLAYKIDKQIISETNDNQEDLFLEDNLPGQNDQVNNLIVQIEQPSQKSDEINALPGQNDQAFKHHTKGKSVNLPGQITQSIGQNDQSIGQNDQSIGQNDRTLPNISLYKPNVADEETVSPPSSNFLDLDKTIAKIFITYFGKNPHFSLVDDIKKTIVLDDSGRTCEENLRIAREAFAQATRQDKMSVAYVLKTIEGMKRDIAIKKEKDEALRKKEEVKAIAGNNYPTKWKGTFNELTGGKNKFLNESPAVDPVKIIPDVDKNSEDYKRKKELFESELREAVHG